MTESMGQGTARTESHGLRRPRRFDDSYGIVLLLVVLTYVVSVSVTEKSTTPLAASDDGVRNRVKERLGYHPTSVEFPGLSPTGLGGGRSTHRLTRCSYHFLEGLPIVW